MFGMWFGRGLPLARGFHWISLPLPILSLYWTSCHRNQSPATVRRTVHFILGQPRGRELLERDRNSKQHAVPDMIALGQSLNWSLPYFLSCFPIIMRSGCALYPMALKKSEDFSFHL